VRALPRLTGGCMRSSLPPLTTAKSGALRAALMARPRTNHQSGRSSQSQACSLSRTPCPCAAGRWGYWLPSLACAGGDLVALRRMNVDLTACEIRIVETTERRRHSATLRQIRPASTRKSRTLPPALAAGARASPPGQTSLRANLLDLPVAVAEPDCGQVAEVFQAAALCVVRGRRPAGPRRAR
jgi:hypothetical protein